MAYVRYNKDGSVKSVTGKPATSKSTQKATKDFVAAGGKVGDTSSFTSKATSVRDASGNVVKLNPGQDVEMRTSQTKGVDYKDPSGVDANVLSGKPGVETSIPSPFTAQITPPNASAPSTAPSVQTSSTDLANSYKQGLSTVQGTPVPETQGQASAVISSSLTPKPYQPTPQIQTEVDTALQAYSQAVAQYLNPDNQRKTLVQEYQEFSKKLGIPGLQSELLDINRIMDGTEDDIRSEVTAASGFATESQIQAMTIGRNKSLLKKAQFISDQLTAAKDQLTTLSNLNAQDRQFADQRMSNGIALLGNMVTIKQNMQKAAQDNYRWYAEKAGMDNLYASTGGDPFNVSMVERTLGMPAGGLQKAAIQAQNDRAKALEKENLQLDVLRSSLETDKMQRRNIQSQIDERNNANTTVVDQAGKVIVEQKEAAALNKELTSSDTYKAIQKAKDSLAFLKQFETKFNQTGATSAVFSPRDNKDLKVKYNTAILNLKEYFNLGVLNGPDETILRSVLPDPTNRSAALTIGSLGIYKPSSATKSGITNMKEMIDKSLDDKFQSLMTQYGTYSPESVTSLNDLGRSYIEQKLLIHPGGFDITVNGNVGHVNPDGSVTPK